MLEKHDNALNKICVKAGKPAGMARFLQFFLYFPVEYKIFIANLLFILFWAAEGRYFSFLPPGIPVILILAMSIVVSFVLIRLALAPLWELSRFMDLVSQGNFQLRARHHPLGEKLINRCSDSLNKMLDALQNALVTLEAGEARSRQQAQIVISAQEDERKRIARELHDETSQALTTLMIGLEQLHGTMPNLTNRCAGCKHDVASLQQLADKTISELHRLAFNLRPSLLDDMGLKHALSWFLREQIQKSGIEANFKTEGSDKYLSDEAEIALFRIAQEALTNVIKYAKASRVNVNLQGGPHGTVLEISDNGVGFDPSGMSENKDRQLGIFGMRERVAILKGEFYLESASGEGTTIRVFIPPALPLEEKVPDAHKSL